MQCGPVSLNLLKLWQLNFQQAGGRRWSFNSGLCTEYYNSPKVMRVLKMKIFTRFLSWRNHGCPTLPVYRCNLC